MRYCFSKIVYLFHYNDLAHSFLYGNSSAYKKTPNIQWRKYYEDIVEGSSLIKNFKNLIKDNEKNQSVHEYSVDVLPCQNLKTFLCKK